ncbi:hypothetical protein [Polynucleobacter brandtiae]|uniref:Uncharacterized protein n=1 Tax=Polynucleobacter brandtiae TaxID=1938816 RepID=A0A2M8VPQ5_9BURK|nr:hypothetical protein [Polynucleobacter brandtiae]PJI79158.1 hypothetical protein B0G85_1260 [Polynucleobacter brandtiae]
MSLFLLLFSPLLFGLYWLIRYQIHQARIRSLVDQYGFSKDKLRPLKSAQLQKLISELDDLRSANQPFELEALAKKYR